MATKLFAVIGATVVLLAILGVLGIGDFRLYYGPGFAATEPVRCG